jgi:endogenous inhibitor of DNA gyrase (YacG/DUF329 family)
MENEAQTLSAKCAICGKNAAEKFRPFCSSRCATLDLGNWLSEGYRIPIAEDDPEDDFPLSAEIDQG